MIDYLDKIAKDIFATNSRFSVHFEENFRLKTRG